MKILVKMVSKKKSEWSKQTHMLFGTNLTRRALREPPFVIVVVQQYKLRGRDSWRVTTPHVQSLVVISMLRGQPKTPPSGDDLAVLDYHLKVMGTIASQLKALSQNTPQSSIILYLGVSPGSWVLSGREYHRQLSLFNPYSVLFQNLQLFFRIFEWHILITYAGDGYCRFRVTIGISLTMPNKKFFFDFLLLKIFYRP